MNVSLISLRRNAMKTVSVCTMFFLLAPSASAATFFWAGTDGNSNNNSQWENSANWSATRTGNGGVGVPGAGDKAVFTKGTGSQLVRVKSTLSVGGIELNNLWTGSLLIGTGTLKIGTGGLRIGSGYFVGGTSQMTLSGSYTQTGGIVRGMQGNLSLSGSMTITTPGTTPAYFTSTGTIIFSGYGTQTFTPLQRGKFTNMVVRNYSKNGTNSVRIATNNLALSGSLTIARGTLDLSTNSKTLTTRGITMSSHASGSLVTDSNVTNSGAVTIASAATLTVSGGTWTQNGTSNQTLDFQGKRVNAFTLNNAGASGNKTETLGSGLNMSGALTVTAGILDTSASNYFMNVTGNTTITSELNARSSGINAGGNWTLANGGSFISGGSTVYFTGTAKTISGSTIFYNLNKQPSASDTLTFAYGTTTRTTNLLTLAPTAGTLSLRSTVSGARWNLTADGNKYQVGTLDVADSNATATIVCTDCVNTGNNSAGWVFTTTTTSGGSTGTSGGGGGGGGGGGRAYLKATPATPAVPGVSPAIPATPGNPKAVITKNMTMKERLAARKQARVEFQARLKARAEQRKAKRR